MCTAVSGHKRPHGDARLLTLSIDGTRTSVSVLPDERALKLEEWLRKTLEPAEGLEWPALTVELDRAFVCEVGLDVTLDSLGLFKNGNHEVVLVVHAAHPGLIFSERTKRLELFKRILQEEWGKRIDGAKATRARDKAIDDAMRLHGVCDIEKKLDFVRDRLRGRPDGWIVKLDGATEGEVPMFRIGDEISMSLRCIDSIGLSAGVDTTTELRVMVESASSGVAFDFSLKLLQADQKDGPDGSKFGAEEVDGASLAWYGVKIFCFPKEQPRGKKQQFTLKVIASDSTTGASAPFYVEEEGTMDGTPDGIPEIDARLVHKWWDERASASNQKAPGDIQNLRVVSSGSSSNILWSPQVSSEVLRELRAFPDNARKRREFLKDVTVWRLVGDKCFDKVAALSSSGWYFDDVKERAGLCMPHYKYSLNEVLSPGLLMKERFNFCDQVLHVMVKLLQEFPFLMFPDVKPKNFLCQPQSNGQYTVVITDLDDVRHVGSRGISRHTYPYRHPCWKDDMPTTKLFEQYAVTVTLLQILLGKQNLPNKWNPHEEVDTFRRRGEDTNISNLLDFDRDKSITTELVRFFKKEINGSGYLGVTQLANDFPLYTTMQTEMTAIASRTESLIQRACTSAPVNSGTTDVQIEGKLWKVQGWQEHLKRLITRWEEDLKKGTLKTFQRPFDHGLKDLLQALKEMKRAVGDEPGDLSRVALVSGMRAVVENILKQLIRIMRKDPTFDAVQLLCRNAPNWPILALKELEKEKSAQGASRRLDSNWYHTKFAIIRTQLAPGCTNIERVHANLVQLRNKTNVAHHTANLSKEQLAQMVSSEEIHSFFMPRIGIFFEGSRSNGTNQTRLLH